MQRIGNRHHGCNTVAPPAATTSQWRRDGSASTHHARPRLPAFLAAIGCLAMTIGGLVYLVDRDVSHAVLIPAIAAPANSRLFGVLGQWLPSFVHPFAFSLFTAAVLPLGSAPRYRVCAAWCAANIAFELGQLPQASAQLARALQGLFGDAPLAQALANYFVRGTFDVADIVAVVIGALMAAAVLRLVRPDTEANHAN